MRDRLSELKQKTQIADDDTSDVVLVLSDSTAAFFVEVESIRKELDEIEKATKCLINVHREIQSSARPSVDMRQKAEDLARTARTTALHVRKRIKELGSHLPQPVSGTSARMLSVQEAMLGRRLQDALSSLSDEQVKQRDRSRALLEAQLRLARASLQSQGAAEEELAKLLHLDQEKVSVFTDNIELQTIEARQDLADIEERKNEILTLERNIRDVRDLFVEISLHVEHQGELINRIENHVTNASEQVEAGYKQVNEANKKQTSTRKKKYFCIIIIVVTVLILATVLTFVV